MSAQASLVKSDVPMIGVEVRPDGVAVVTMNDVTEQYNTITRRFGEELRDAFDRLARDTYIRAAVLASGKPESFVVGANVDMLREIKLAREAEKLSGLMAAGLKQLRAGEKPVVAAVHGPALGGGFEIALACHALVASDDPRTVLGLPEVQLGLLPAANGLLRIAERAGVGVAIALGLTGKSFPARRAQAMHLVDEVCPAPILLEVAIQRARDLAEGRRGARRTLHALGLALERNPIGRALLFKKARAEMRKKTHGLYPAPEKILDVLECFAARGFDEAAALEAKSFGELVVSETAHRLIEIFKATAALKKDRGVDDPAVTPIAVEAVGVLGAGLMGAGIALVTATNAGLPVRVRDRDDAAVGRGMKAVRDGVMKRRRSTREEKEQILARVTGASALTGFHRADVVIEAVFEDLALKHKVLAEVEAVAKPGCIFASNTSSIPIREIAKASKRPENVIGMHYFSPVPKMPLLEIVRHERTSPRVVATCVALGKKQGKTVIVVNDGPGFYTSRILAPYMNEAAQLVAEGVPIDAIDRALVDWGFPIGPVQLMDEVGIDVAAHVGSILVEALGARMAPPPIMAKLVEDDRKGKKNGRGFYRYDTKKRQVDPTIYRVLGVEPKTQAAAAEIQMRCALQMISEALRCLEERVVRNARDADVGAVFGLGFPPFRGGPMRTVDTLGAEEALRRVRAYEDRFGARWSPAPLLVELAKTGKKLR
jgi:3-hydroxyacyl-CoA dehydrogenase/enoyl-CoA hydratase/3-hydroxybutyryl-CoA epimerase